MIVNLNVNLFCPLECVSTQMCLGAFVHFFMLKSSTSELGFGNGGGGGSASKHPCL